MSSSAGVAEDPGIWYISVEDMKRTSVLLALSCAAVAIAPAAFGFAGALGIFSAHRDVGITPEKGSVMFDAARKSYRVTGGGADIWSRADAFQFVYKRVSGDASLTADVQFEGKGVEEHRKAALMFRQSLTAHSAYADAAVHGDGLASLQYRPTEKAETLEVRSDVKGPMHIRIERHTDQFTISAGVPGQPMRTSGPVTVHLSDPVYVGLAVSSHNAGVLETVVFSNVQLEGGRAEAGSRNFALLR